MSVFPEDEPSQLIQGVRDGEPEAMEHVFRRYFTHLVKYARKRMENRQAAADGEDAAISAMRTFVRRAGEGEFDQLANQNELFRLLSVIVLRKSMKYQAKDRRLVHTSALESDGSSSHEGILAIDSRPDVEQIAIVQETLDQLLDGLVSGTSKKIVVMQLEGHPNPYIANELNVSIRTVNRHIHKIREVLSSIEEHERDS